jgi:hypothetical protein
MEKRDQENIRDEQYNPAQENTERGTHNPFKDEQKVATEPTPQEEAELEQERKEALTERD